MTIPSTSSMFSPGRAALVTAALLAVLLAACGGGDAGQSANAADLIHVHGLAESDDGLYVATHTGLFEVVGERIRRVGGATHDLMGFTVAGPDDLLASGHPDLRVEELQVNGKPPLLGLVHSADGQAWESMSLLGEVDFHSLEAAHGQVYGFDGTTGRFLVSEDRRNWETRAQNLAIVDFAVSPDDPEVIVATAEGGVGRSGDGGRTWNQASTEPFVFVDWSTRGLYGVRPDGQLAVSDDEGGTWEGQGTLGGNPEALHVSDGAVYAAVAERGIVRSTDGGRTFETLVDTSG